MTLRDILFEYRNEDWFRAHERDIIFELNHLELHSLDDYLLKMHEKGIKAASNPNNSNIAYVLGITDEEPTQAITAVGGSFPDIDLDFEHERREEVKQHLVDRYGEDRVAAIGTFMIAKAKGIFKDVARMYDLPFSDSNEISKMIDDMCESLDDALENSPDLKAKYDSDPKIKEIIDYAKELEGCIKAIGVHACGMCISIDPISDTVPLFESKGSAVTQFDGPTLEKIGLIKYDILGLKNLTVISKTFELIKKTRGETIVEEDIPLNDPDAYRLIAEGNSLGVFQVEGSQGLRDFAAASRPQNVEELAAVISLYRPGPMGMKADISYIARKSGQESSSFDVPEFGYIFEDTYGLLIFQEQLMRLAADMCGFNDIETDVLRKAVGKKDRELLLAQKEKFVEGAVKHSGQDRDKISSLFDEMEEFARYCFNKSHAVCYAKIGAQTAWLKANYPSEYMAALISCEPDPESQSMYIEDARRNGVEVLPPDLNQSAKDFTVGEHGEILFGFNCIKGVGIRVVDKILSVQPFSSFGEFLLKTYHAKGVNKKVIEALIHCGACDTFGYKRSCMLAGFEKFLMDYVGLIDKDTEYPNEGSNKLLSCQDDYFDSHEMAEFPLLKILDKEKELLGIHISGNPFDIVATLIEEDYYTVKQFVNGYDNMQGYVLGIINKVKRLTTKKGDPMAFIDCSDENGDHHSFVLFPQVYQKYADQLKDGIYVQLYVRMKSDAKGKSLLVNSVKDLTSEVSKASDKLEADNSIKSIGIHTVGPPGTARLKSLLKQIDNYRSDEETGYHMTLCIDIGDTTFRMKRFNSKRIDIPTLRSFSRFSDVYISRST